MDPLDDEQRLQVEKTLKRINRKLFTSEVIESVITTINKLRSGELLLSDWFAPGIMDYTAWSYQWNLNKFVPINST